MISPRLAGLTSILVATVAAGVPADPDMARWFGEVLQYISGAGILALLAFSQNITKRLGNVETLLSDPNQGLSPVVAQLRQRLADMGSDLQNYLARADNQASEINRLREREMDVVHLEARLELVERQMQLLPHAYTPVRKP